MDPAVELRKILYICNTSSLGQIGIVNSVTVANFNFPDGCNLRKFLLLLSIRERCVSPASNWQKSSQALPKVFEEKKTNLEDEENLCIL